MEAASAIEYLGALLNRPVAADTPLRLSSAQRARFAAWLHARGVQPADAQLSSAFTVGALLGSGMATVAAAPAPAAANPSSEASSASTTLDVGMDIQSVAELTDGVNLLDLKADEQMTRLFTARELSYAQVRPDTAQTLAGLFAAKEAVRKCTGGPTWSADRFRSVEVLPDEHGRPTTTGFSVSISHSAGLAAAIACRSAVAATAPPAPSPAPARAEPAPSGRLDRILLVAVLVVIVLQLAIVLGRFR